MFLGYSRHSSFHTLPKLIWCGSWGCNLGQSLSNHRPYVFCRRKHLRRRIFLSRNRSSLAAEQFHSDASLEAVYQRASNKLKKLTVDDGSLWDHNGCIRVRRYACECCRPECVIERYSGLTPGVLVWGAISYYGRSNLLRIEGNLNSNRYVREVLQPEVFPFLQDIPGAIMHVHMLQRLFETSV
ncbi:uncharacterized protein TNCV_584711 [Trichonephila clavipes]|nr:uncharacterized protein TNCV_584711 [Trichonephila clavipes]